MAPKKPVPTETLRVSYVLDTSGEAVVLYWTIPIDKMTHRTLYDALYRNLDAVVGVDHVNLSRYSGHIAIATHVAKAKEVIEDLRYVMTEDPDVATALETRGIKAVTFQNQLTKKSKSAF